MGLYAWNRLRPKFIGSHELRKTSSELATLQERVDVTLRLRVIQAVLRRNLRHDIVPAPES
jgi:hypothetical protein